MLLRDKSAIVTGAAQGIGKGIATVFCSNGATVVICDRNGEEAAAAAEEIGTATGNRPYAMAADVTRKKDIESVIAETIERFGRIDVLVNNAGVQRFAPFLELPEEDWDLHFNTNVKGTFLFSQAVARVMVKAGGGKIVNIASDSGVAPTPGDAAAYCASKSAVIALTRNIARELGPYGVYCNAICPGAIGSTGMMEYFRGYTHGEGDQACIEAAVLKRLGTPEDVGNVALFLASSLSNFITGEHILATGGDIMKQ